jgi:hypothetical protein
MRFYHRVTQGELRVTRIKDFSGGASAVPATPLVLDNGRSAATRACVP